MLRKARLDATGACTILWCGELTSQRFLKAIKIGLVFFNRLG